MQKLHGKTASKLTLEWKWQKCDCVFYLDPIFHECYFVLFIEHGPLKEEWSVDKIYNLANQISDFDIYFFLTV